MGFKKMFSKGLSQKDKSSKAKNFFLSKFAGKLGLGLLSIKITILFVILLSIILFMGKTAIIDYKKTGLEEELQKRGKGLVEIFTPWCIKALEEQDDILLLNILNSLRQQEDVMYNVILNEKGIVIGHTNVYKLGKEYNDDITRKALGASKLLIQSYRRGNNNLYDYGIPLLSLGEKLGVLRFGLSRDKLDNELDHFVSKIKFFMWMIIILLGAEVFFLVNYKISRPLIKIKEAVNLLGGQYFEYKVHVETKDEIGGISKGIENFIEQIKREFEFHEEKNKRSSLLEVKRLGEMLDVLLENSDRKVLVADVNNNIVFSNMETQEGKKVQGHLLDIIKEKDFVALLNDAFSKRGEIVKGTVNFLCKKRVSILTLANEEERGPKTIVVLENIL
ncbi:hypothetical protein KAU39_00135 [bacterium]|nr:hypothetical protein [bacterium]